jgi:hypothetical protein
MQVILSERLLKQTIRNFEDLGDMTDDEMMVQFHRYRQRLLDQMQHYGLYFGGMVEQAATVAAYEFSLNPDGDRETIIEGLKLIQPLAVTVQVSDIPALVQNPVFVGAFQSGWSHVAQELERIQPSEILDKIESLAGRFVNGGATVEAVLDYDSWALSHGVPNLPSNYEQAQEFRRAEEENYRKSGGDTSSRFHVRLPDGSWA